MLIKTTVAVTLLALAACIVAGRVRRPDSQVSAPLGFDWKSEPGPGPTLPRSPDESPRIEDRIRSLPERLVETLQSLERSLLHDPASVLPGLLARYEREGDPGLKGLLAVLLAVDASTHPRILEDHGKAVAEDREIFRGLALFALVAGRSSGSDEGRNFWPNLVKFVELTPKLLRLDRAHRNGEKDESFFQLFYEVHQVRSLQVGESTITTWSSPQFDERALDSVRGTRDPGVRQALLEANDGSGWDWIRRLAYRSLWKSARDDREFAGEIFDWYAGARDRYRMMKGLELLSNEAIPPRHVASLEIIARTSLRDPDLFARAVDMLGHQEGATVASILVELHAQVHTLDEHEAGVLKAMRNQGSPAFEIPARTSLTSANWKVREAALEVLASVAAAASADPLVHAAQNDSENEVRKTALYLMVQANRWTAAEEEALVRMASTDPHQPLRKLAGRLLSAPDRTTDDAWVYFELEAGEDLLDLPN